MMRKSLVAVLLLGLAACGDDDGGSGTVDARPQGTVDAGVPTPDAMDPVARGSYLVNTVLLCIDCHTPRNPDGSFIMEKHLSGVECFVDVDPATAGTGCLHSRNLTNHETGLMNRTDEQIKEMFTNGMRPNGSVLNNVMPYWLLHRLTAADADAIVAYLRTVPGVDHTVPANEAPWTNPVHVDPITEAEVVSVTATAAGTTQESADRGRYLANFACVDCHTETTAPGSPRPLNFSKAFQGGRPFEIGAPFPDVVYTMNLTPHATGLAGYTLADIVKVLREGKDKDGKGVCPPMPSALMGPLQGITEADATDIANYLLNLPPADNMIPMTCVSPF